MSAPLLQLRRLSVTFPGRGWPRGRRRPVQALRAVDLELSAGETLALVGESGSGKSTLARAVLGLQPPSRGQVLLKGRDVHALPRGDEPWLHTRVQLIFQDPTASLDPRMRIERIVGQGLRHRGLARGAQLRQRIVGLLESVGLSADHLERLPHQLSGGQRQRVAIARALALEPALLVCDEPVSALDAVVKVRILELLRSLQRERGLACLLITHDLAVAARTAQRIAVLLHGTLVERGPTSEILKRPQHPYTRALLQAVPNMQPGGRPEVLLTGEVSAERAGCIFRARCPRVHATCLLDPPPPWKEIGPDHSARCWLAERPETPA